MSNRASTKVFTNSRAVLLVACAIACGAVASCSAQDAAPTPVAPLTHDEMLDPQSCSGCHAEHYQQWSGSMHAYAAEDPLFIAMNARGQRETKGALGTFCVQCHAPMAVKLGLTKDGLNLASLPQPVRGVTCYYCHSVESVDGAHNAPQKLANDDVMRASISDPIGNHAHASSYSKLHDGERVDSAPLCGACHDLQNGNGVDLQRTFAEWKGSLFSHDVPGVRLSCASCHMPGKDGLAAKVKGAPRRRVHDHMMPGVDVAISPFAEADAQRAAVQANLDPSLVPKLCVTPKPGGWQIEYWLDDAFAGHDWPSGASYHRRAWVEITASSKGAVVWHTGAVPADKAASTLTAADDPSFWHLGDQLLDAAGKPVEMLWPATSVAALQLPPAVTSDRTDPKFYHAVIKDFDVPPADLDDVKAQVHIRPVDYDFVDDLIASGDLDPSYRAKVTTFTLSGTVLEWTKDLGPTCIPSPK